MLVGGEEEPVLRGDEGGGAAHGAELETALRKGGGEVSLTVLIVFLHMGFHDFSLLPTGEVWDIGDDEVILFPQEAVGLGESAGGDP